MICYCEEAYELPECTQTITIGTILPSTIYWVSILNTSTNYRYVHEVTSDLVGLVTIDSKAPSTEFYNKDSFYQIWVTLPNELSKKLFLVNGVSIDCVSLTFYKNKGEQIVNTVIKLIEP